MSRNNHLISDPGCEVWSYRWRREANGTGT